MHRVLLCCLFALLLSVPVLGNGISPRTEDLALTAMELASKGYTKPALQVCADMKNDKSISPSEEVLSYLAKAYVHLQVATATQKTPERATAVKEAASALDTANALQMPESDWLKLFSDTLKAAVEVHQTRELLRNEKLNEEQLNELYSTVTRSLSNLVSLHTTLALHKQQELERHLARYEHPMEARVIQGHSRPLSLCANFLCKAIADCCETMASVYRPDSPSFAPALTVSRNTLKNKLEDHYFIDSYEYAVEALGRIELLANAQMRAILDRKLTIAFEDSVLQDIVSTLSQLSGFEIELRAEGEKATQRVNLSIKNQSLETTLNLLCASSGLSWFIADGHVVITDKRNAPQGDKGIPAEKRYRIERYDNIHIPLAARYMHYALDVKTADMNAADTTLKAVVDALSEKYGIELILEMDDRMQMTTLKLENATLREALEWLSRFHGLTWFREGEVIVLVVE